MYYYIIRVDNIDTHSIFSSLNSLLDLLLRILSHLCLGDLSRPEVLKRFSAGEALACVIAIDDLVATNKAVAALKDQFPDLPLIVRAKNSQHQMRLEKIYGGFLFLGPRNRYPPIYDLYG